MFVQSHAFCWSNLNAPAATVAAEASKARELFYFLDLELKNGQFQARLVFKERHETFAVSEQMFPFHIIYLAFFTIFVMIYAKPVFMVWVVFKLY